LELFSPKVSLRVGLSLRLSPLSATQGYHRIWWLPIDPESIRDAKGWLQQAMLPGRKYSETVDQASLASKFDLNAARRSPSFDKMYREVGRFCSLAITV